MKPLTLFITIALVAFIAITLVPKQSQGGRLNVRIIKKLGGLLLLNRKKYLFTVPFPLPIPIPLLKKTQPIIYKEKVAVPVPVSEPGPVPEQYNEPNYESNYDDAGGY